MADRELDERREGAKLAVGRAVEWTRKRVREAGQAIHRAADRDAGGRVGWRDLRKEAGALARAAVESVGGARDLVGQLIGMAREALGGRPR